MIQHASIRQDKGTPRTKTLAIAVSEYEEGLIEQAARVAWLPKSVWARSILMNEAMKVKQGREVIETEADERKANG